MNSPSDWNGVTGQTPWSCYKQNYTSTIIFPPISENAYPHYSQGQLFERGCKKYVSDFVEDILRPVLIAVIIILVIQVWVTVLVSTTDQYKINIFNNFNWNAFSNSYAMWSFHAACSSSMDESPVSKNRSHIQLLLQLHPEMIEWGDQQIRS